MIVPVPKGHNSRNENEAIKAGEVPEGWENNPAKLRQKDLDARWTKKHGRSHYGYKNHISIDKRHKFVRRYTVTNAARHDSQGLDAVLDKDNTCRDVWADSSYRSAETEAKLAELRFRSRFPRNLRSTFRRQGRRPRGATLKPAGARKFLSRCRGRR